MRIAGRFRVERPLGGGGTSSVWEATDLEGGARVAVKLLHRRYRDSPEALRRLTLEAKLLAELDHPNIARALAVDLAGPTPFFAMELLEGRTLFTFVGERAARDRHLSPRELVSLFTPLLTAIAYAHARGVIHRDLKPSNVMVLSTGEVKVLDFGFAKYEVPASDATTRGRVIGTDFYMSPEQARGEGIDESTDVFSLGVILFELCTLRRLWHRDANDALVPAYCEPAPQIRANASDRVRERILSEARPRASELRPALGTELDAILERALAVDPRARPPSADALRVAFMAAMERPAALPSAAPTRGARAPYDPIGFPSTLMEQTEPHVADTRLDAPMTTRPPVPLPAAPPPHRFRPMARALLIFAAGLAAGALASGRACG